MKVSNFLQNIALGELSGSPYVDMKDYELIPEKIPTVINSLNQGLNYLYGLLPIKDNNVLVHLVPNLSLYYLDSEYAISNPNSKFKYLLDSPNKPFTNDVIRITSVFSEDKELTLNDELSAFGVFTPEVNCIRVPDEVKRLTNLLNVTYKAGHKRISLLEGKDSNENIEIPFLLEPVLQTYVASILYMNMGGQYQTIGNQLYAKFRTMLDEFDIAGLGKNTQTGLNVKPMLGGWV